MLPIRDHNPSGRTPYVTWTLIGLNIAVFLLSLPLSDQPAQLAMFYRAWAITPAAISDGAQAHTLVTSMFLHGGFMHLAGNMLFLWIFGDNIEDQMGHLGFLIFYLAAGIGAGLAQVISEPYSLIPTVGASGAIAGVMGGYLLLFPRAKIDILLILIIFFKVFSVPAWLMLGLWFAIQLFSGLASSAELSGVAYWAHAGGFIIGLLLSLPIWLRRGGTAFWSRNQGQPPHPETKYSTSPSRIPTIPRRRK